MAFTSSGLLKVSINFTVGCGQGARKPEFPKNDVDQVIKI